MLVIWIIRYTPMFLVERLAPFIALLVALTARKSFRTLDRNIQHFYGLPCNRGFGLLFKKQLIQHQILCFFETIKIIYDPKKITVDGLDKLKSLFAKEESSYQKGHLLITAHLGSWELIGALAKELTEKPFYALAKEPSRALQKNFLNHFRSEMPVQVLWSNKPSFLKQMMRLLEEKIWMSFVMDQKPEKRTGPMVSFFGETVAFSGGPAACAVRDGKPVIAAFCVRKGPFHYELLSQCMVASGHKETNVQELTQKFANEIERVIRLYPEQWCWNYKRWKFSDE